MKYEWAMQWADALESGEYPQARNALRTKTGFCCLGVACEIGGLKSSPTTRYSYSYEGETVSLPPTIVDEFGLYTNDGEIRTLKAIKINGKDYGSLMQANDDHGVSFKDIAQYIRENWKDL